MTTADKANFGCEECPIAIIGKMCAEVRTGLKKALPEEFWAHRRAARKEALLALRSLLDAAIERVEERPKRARKTTKIKVEQKE